MANTEAVYNSLSKNFYPTLITSVTTCLGFVSFSTSKVVPIADLGVEVGLGVLFAWISSYFLFSGILLLYPLKGKAIKEEKKEMAFRKKLLSFSLKNQKLIMFSSLILALFCYFHIL